MNKLSLLFLPLLLTTGCFKSRPNTLGTEEYRAASGASATIGEVSDSIRPEKPQHSAVLDAAKGNLDQALQVDKASPKALGAPLTTAAELDADPSAAAARAKEEAERRGDAVSKEQETSWFESLISWGGWATVAGIALWAARLAGVPGVQYLSDPLVRMIGKPWIQKIEAKEKEAQERIGSLAATVEGSMVGRQGLEALDRTLGGKFSSEISRMTGGKADTVEGLFVWLASAHHTDAGKSQQVDGILKEIKDHMKTEGGLSDLVSKLLAKPGEES